MMKQENWSFYWCTNKDNLIFQWYHWLHKWLKKATQRHHLSCTEENCISHLMQHCWNEKCIKYLSVWCWQIIFRTSPTISSALLQGWMGFDEDRSRAAGATIFPCSWPWTQIRTEHECRGKICPQFRQPERLEPQLTALVDPGRPQSISVDARQLVEAWTWTKWRRTSITILISSSFNLCRGLFALLCRDDLSRFPSAIRHRLTALFQQIEHTSQGSGLCQPPILPLYFFFLSCSLSGFKAVLLILLHSSFLSVFWRF